MQLFNLPNFLTLINLFSGCVGIVLLFTGKAEFVPICVLISAVADFFDGMAARALGISSPIGGELDSLADMVSFGVLPATIFFYLISNSGSSFTFLPFAGYILALFAALRLAKFNVDTRQSTDFIGMATPACTLYVLAIFLTIENQQMPFADWLNNEWVLCANILVLSYLMIAEIPMFSFKLKSRKWQDNKIRLVFLLTSVVFIGLFQYFGLALSLVAYVILSMLQNFTQK